MAQLDDSQKAALARVAASLVAAPRGILAADQEPKDMDKILMSAGGGGEGHCSGGPEQRLAFRKATLTADGLGKYLGGVILHHESVMSPDFDFAAALARQDIALGGTMDQEFTYLEETNEPVTGDIDAIEERFREYKSQECKFVKWRTIIQVSSASTSPSLPSDPALEQNLDLASRYAAAAQRHGLVPICEPDLSYAGDFPAERFREVAERCWALLFRKLAARGVYLPGIVLKTCWVAPGFDLARSGANDAECARLTVESIRGYVPPEVPGVAFLSGGMSLKRCVRMAGMISTVAASDEGNAVGQEGSGGIPRLSFSYGRALLEAPAGVFAASYKAGSGVLSAEAVAAVGVSMIETVRLASEASVETGTP